MILTAQPLVKSAETVIAEESRRLGAINDALPASTHSKLSGHIRLCWDDAVDAKRPVQDRMLDCARRVRAEYSPEVLAAINEVDGSATYIPATAIKKDAARDYILDIYRASEKPWSIKPTPIPELPPDIQVQAIKRVQTEIMQSNVPLSDDDILALDERARKEITDAMNEDAKTRSEAMEKRIHDIVVEGGWFPALAEVVDDIVTYPAGIFKGPVMRMEDRQTFIQKDDGSWDIEVKPKLVHEFERVSPFDFYPQRNIKTVDDGYCFERLRLNRRKVSEMKGVKGYNDDEIDAVLKECASGGIKSNWLYDSTDITADDGEERDNFMDSPEGRIDGLEFWGSVPGQWLIDWGMSASKVPNPNKEYPITAILIGTHVIRAAINPHPLGKKPYHVVSWRKNPGAFWGYGIPEIIASIQDDLNAVARALINNVAIASGPQVAVDYALMRVGTDLERMVPWKIIQLDSSELNSMGGNNNNRLPIEFFQPTMNAEILLRVINAFMQMMDEYTGIPAYTHGVAEGSGAGATSSGLAMLMTAAGKIIKSVASKIDTYIIESSITRIFEFLMQYDPDNSIKGDATVVVSGSGSLIAKEQKLIRMRELMDSTRNDVAMQVIGLPGYAALMRKVFHAYELDLDDIIPSVEELMQRDQAMQAAIQAKAMPATANLDVPQAQTLDTAGQPVVGQDNNMFTQQPQQGA